MKIAYMPIAAFLLISCGIAPAAFAQAQEEIETYLVAPYTQDKMISVTMTDGKKVEGKVLRGDENKIVVAQAGGPVELLTEKIATVRLRRPKRSAKVDFIGNLLGGIGFGFGGAALGKHAAESMRGDGTPGKIGPIVGGVVFGLVGGYVGRRIARHAASEDVTLKVMQGPEGPQSKATSGEQSAPGPSTRVPPPLFRH